MKLLIAALLAVFSTGAMAEWTYLTGNANGAFDVYIDKTTIRKRGNVAKMWDLTDYKSLQKAAGGESFLSNKSLQEYDCVEIKSRFLTLSYFSGNMGKGEAVLTHQDDDKWQDVAPNSIVMMKWKAACKK